MEKKNYENNVFINCPFDKDYNDIFHAMVFTVFDCGFIARCAKEENNGAAVRIEKITNIIEQSKYGIHDISRTESDKKTKLPRFNMPLELGLFLGATRYGNKTQKQKVCLIMDKHEHRYEKYISDIKGQDISAHNNSIPKTITLISGWLRNNSKRKPIPGGSEIHKRYKLFTKELPKMCDIAKIRVDELGFNDYCGFVSEWISENRTIDQ